MWSAGVAGGGAYVAARRVATRGFGWLVAGTSAGLAAAAWAAGGGAWSAAGLALAIAAALLSGRTYPQTGALILAAVAGVIAATRAGPLVPALTGAVALGFITDEMLLGHWFLVDPRLPRSSLRHLAVVALLGIILDSVYVVSARALTTGSAMTRWAFLILALTSVVLIAGVLLAIRERGYSAVMAATGLSYLAVLTVAGAAMTGRLLIG